MELPGRRTGHRTWSHRRMAGRPPGVFVQPHHRHRARTHAYRRSTRPPPAARMEQGGGAASSSSSSDTPRCRPRRPGVLDPLIATLCAPTRARAPTVASMDTHVYATARRAQLRPHSSSYTRTYAARLILQWPSMASTQTDLGT